MVERLRFRAAATWVSEWPCNNRSMALRWSSRKLRRSRAASGEVGFGDFEVLQICAGLCMGGGALRSQIGSATSTDDTAAASGLGMFPPYSVVLSRPRGPRRWADAKSYLTWREQVK